MEEIAGLGIIVSFFVSGLGFVFFSYGRKMSRPPQVIGGLLLMVFPYFVSSILGMLVTAALLSLAIVLASRMGW